MCELESVHVRERLQAKQWIHLIKIVVSNYHPSQKMTRIKTK